MTENGAHATGQTKNVKVSGQWSPSMVCVRSVGKAISECPTVAAQTSRVS